MTRKDITPKTGTLVGPSTFRAHVTDKATGEHFDFDASTVAQYDQGELFKEYTTKAKSLGFKTAVGTYNPAGGNWGDAANFTAPAFTLDERHWLGREVSFRNSISHSANGMDTYANYGGDGRKRTGTVSSLAPAPSSVWVHVAGEGFFSVKISNLLMGVNA